MKEPSYTCWKLGIGITGADRLNLAHFKWKRLNVSRYQLFVYKNRQVYKNVVTFNEEKMTNLLSHCAVRSTMHAVIESRIGKNPGKHFLCILCADARSEAHGLLHILSLGKTFRYLREWCFARIHSCRAVRYLLHPGLCTQFSPREGGSSTRSRGEGGRGHCPWWRQPARFPAADLPKMGTGQNRGEGALLADDSLNESGIAGT